MCLTNKASVFESYFKSLDEGLKSGNNTVDNIDVAIHKMNKLNVT